MCFLSGVMGKSSKKNFLMILTNFILILNLRMGLVEKMSGFYMLMSNFWTIRFPLTYTLKLQIDISVLTTRHYSLFTAPKGSPYTVKLWELIGYLHEKKTLKDTKTKWKLGFKTWDERQKLCKRLNTNSAAHSSIHAIYVLGCLS